jgi:hypothetical protein
MQQLSIGASFYTFYEALPSEEQQIFLDELLKNHPDKFTCNVEVIQDDNQNEDHQKRVIQIYDAYRDDLRKRQLSNNENYDKTILTLSSSGLALSLTAIKFAIPLATAKYLFLLQSSWWLFGATILIAIIAYPISNVALNKQLENAEDYYARGIEDAFSRKNWYSIINDQLNIVAGLAFIIATAAIIAFVTFNIN